jgi:hypothetical protein
MMFSEIKLSPLILFIILLLVLVIATAVKNLGLVSEGFNSFWYSADSFTDKKVFAYDNTRNITKIYDDIFYDPRNGNIVAVYGTQYTSEDDNTGQSVTQIDIAPRIESNIVSYSKGSDNKTLSQVANESKKSTVDPVDTQWSKKFTDNQVCYLAWGTKTFIYVMNLMNAKTAGNTTVGNTSITYSGSYQPAAMAYYKDKSLTLSSKYTVNNAELDNKRTIYLQSSYTYSGDGNDDKNVIETYYDTTKGVYQLVNNVKYDVANGNLLIQTQSGANKQVSVFYRDARHLDVLTPDVVLTSSTSTSTDASKKAFATTANYPYFLQDTLGNHTIMYWPNDDNTIIIVFANALDSDGSLKIVKYRRFLKGKVYTGSASNYADEKQNDLPSDISGNSNFADAFARWYMYFNANATGSSALMNPNDYLLKTQIVPPVCPACPGCTGVCTDCGGNGGSGTKTAGQQSLAFDNKTIVGATGNLIANTVGTAGNIVNSTVGTAGNVVNKSVDVAGNVVNKTVDTASNVVGKTFDAAGNVVGKTFDAAGNIVGKTFDAAGNLLGSTADRLGLDRVGYNQSYRGPQNTSSSQNASGYPSNVRSTSEYRPGSNNTGVSTLPNATPKDAYSYNGALQSKGGNFIPVTTDFSRFGR